MNTKNQANIVKQPAMMQSSNIQTNNQSGRNANFTS